MPDGAAVPDELFNRWRTWRLAFDFRDRILTLWKSHSRLRLT